MQLPSIEIVHVDREYVRGADGMDWLIGLALGAFASAEEEATVRRALLEYCRRDTLALVELHRALGRLGPGPGNARQQEAR